ncbi:mCG140397, partial [Mus musculus]
FLNIFYYIFSSITFPMLSQKSLIPPPHFPTYPFPFFWPWRSPELGHIQFACPMGLSFQ